MELSSYRSGAPQLAHWPGTRLPVGLRPLSPCFLEDLAEVTRRRWQLAGLPARGLRYERAVRAAVLGAALCCPSAPVSRLGGADRVAGALTGRQLDELFDRWLEVQEADVPPARLKTEVALQLEDDGQVLLDALRAVSCQSVTDYYGQPAEALTAGQVIYYLTLRAAFHDLHDDDDGWEICRSLTAESPS